MFEIDFWVTDMWTEKKIKEMRKALFLFVCLSDCMCAMLMFHLSSYTILMSLFVLLVSPYHYP